MNNNNNNYKFNNMNNIQIENINFPNNMNNNNIINNNGNNNNMNYNNNNFNQAQQQFNNGYQAQDQGMNNNLNYQFQNQGQNNNQQNNYQMNINFDNSPDNEVKILNNGSPKYNDIIHIISKICKASINECLNSNNDISSYISQKLNNAIKGEWFILVCQSNENEFNFKFSEIKESKIMIFNYMQRNIYVCKFA